MFRNNREEAGVSDTETELKAAYADESNRRILPHMENTAPFLFFTVLIIMLFLTHAYTSGMLSGLSLSETLITILIEMAAYVVPMLVFVLVLQRKRKVLSLFRMQKKGTAKFCVSAMFLLFFCMILIKSVICGFSDIGEARIVPDGGTSLSLAVLSSAVLPAILEEALFRGVMFSLYERSCGGFFAMAATSVLFACIHFSPAEFPAYFAAGLILGCTAYITRSIVPSIILHFINNLFSLFFENTVFRIARESKSGVLAIFILAAVTLLMLFWFLFELESVCKERYNAALTDGDESAKNKKILPDARLLPGDADFGESAVRVAASPFFIVSIIVFIVYSFIR